MRIILDGKEVCAQAGDTILDVAVRAGVDIPSLCHFPGHVPPSTSCLVCIVKLGNRFVPSCAVYVEEGMRVESETDEVHSLRRSALELLLSDHISHCRTCGDGRKKCKILKLIAKYKVNRHRFGNRYTEESSLTGGETVGEPFSTYLADKIVFDARKCIKCGICIQITKQKGEEFGLTFFGRGFDTSIGIPFDSSFQQAVQYSTAEIVSACPTAAITWKELSQ